MKPWRSPTGVAQALSTAALTAVNFAFGIGIAGYEPARPELRGIELDDGVWRRAGHDPIVVGRVALGLDQPLETAQGATDPVGTGGTHPVKRGDDSLGIDRHQVVGTIRVVHQLFGMAECETPALVPFRRTAVPDTTGVAAWTGAWQTMVSRPATAAAPAPLRFRTDGSSLTVWCRQPTEHTPHDVIGR